MVLRIDNMAMNMVNEIMLIVKNMALRKIEKHGAGDMTKMVLRIVKDIV